MKAPLSKAERFAKFTAPDGDCLVWTGRKFWNGYGQYNDGPKVRTASRVAWELLTQGAS